MTRRRLNVDERRALKAAAVADFVTKYERKAQRGQEPNDRKYDADVERAVKNMNPEELGRLLSDDEE